MVAYFNLLATILSLISLALLLAAMGSWSTDKDTIEQNNWLHSDNKDSGVWFGLQAVATEAGDVYKYAKCDFGETSDICDSCDSAGQNAASLLVIAWVACLFNLILNGVSISMEGPVKFAAVGTSLLAPLFTMAAFASFMGSDCYDDIKSQINAQGDNVKYGASSGLVLAALFLLSVSVVPTVLGAVAPAEPVPAHDSKPVPTDSN
ncbi:hypothetical protein B484DRAFT_456797 [Ochromonadaceae sp. CCMP2298]|nr:hypothetical protein B484DRAFT_456797 [Ochromonadaceae sp. CCMP2298]|mmetsp:Transcript_27206/g.60928  ORF Transcript_27206/g.60928 Transcript_27206/m.60928 type:complete len:206 (+) Transcript_27206:307-924(+)